MKKLLLVGIAAFFLTGSTAEDTTPYSEDYLMDFACTVTYTDCSGLQLPHIGVTQLNWAGSGVAGMYFPGTDIILIDIDFLRGLPELELTSILVHEMAHYIYDQTRGAHTACETEAFAWHVGNSFLVSVGLEDATIYDWYEWYNCAAPGPVVAE
mgnify:CR=1 FL=1